MRIEDMDSILTNSLLLGAGERSKSIYFSRAGQTCNVSGEGNAMTERRLPGRYVPVRVLLRPQVESGLRDRELAGIQGNEHNNEQQSQELTSLLQVQHHAYPQQ